VLLLMECFVGATTNTNVHEPVIHAIDRFKKLIMKNKETMKNEETMKKLKELLIREWRFEEAMQEAIDRMRETVKEEIRAATKDIIAQNVSEEKEMTKMIDEVEKVATERFMYKFEDAITDIHIKLDIIRDAIGLDDGYDA